MWSSFPGTRNWEVNHIISFKSKGYPLLSDDVLPIFIDEKPLPKIVNGFLPINLWADIIEEVGENPKTYLKFIQLF